MSIDNGRSICVEYIPIILLYLICTLETGKRNFFFHITILLSRILFNPLTAGIVSKPHTKIIAKLYVVCNKRRIHFPVNVENANTFLNISKYEQPYSKCITIFPFFAFRAIVPRYIEIYRST